MGHGNPWRDDGPGPKPPNPPAEPPLSPAEPYVPKKK